ncbi:MAG: hypothetical protein IJX71_07350 [Oscillospiraceae bacterium]|nr:hypothetical protein [Oscillospiraceae bacterium]
MAYNSYKHYRLMVIVISLVISIASSIFLTAATDNLAPFISIVIYEIVFFILLNVETVSHPTDETLAHLLSQVRSGYSETELKSGQVRYMNAKAQADYLGLLQPLALLIGCIFVAAALAASEKLINVGTLITVLLLLAMLLSNRKKLSKVGSDYYSIVNECRFSSLFCAISTFIKPEFAQQHRSARQLLGGFMAVDYACLCLFWEGKEQEALTILDRAWEIQSRKMPAMAVSYHSLRSTLLEGSYSAQLSELTALREAAERLPKGSKTNRAFYQAALENHALKTMTLEERWEEALSVSGRKLEQTQTPLEELNWNYTRYRAAKALGREDIMAECAAVIQKYAPNKTL